MARAFVIANQNGGVPTLYRPEWAHAQEAVAELRSVFEDKALAPILDAEEVAQAPVAQKCVLACRPASAAAIAFQTLAEAVIHVHTQSN